MKIGIFTDTYYPEINGVANSAFQLKKELEQRGNLVYIFTVSNPNVTEKEARVYRMGSVPFPFLKDRRVGYSLSRHWIDRVRSLQLDMIHTQTEFSVGHIGRRIAKQLNIPLVHTYHTIYEDYTHYLRVPGNDHLKGVVRSLSRKCCDKAETVVVPTGKVQNLLTEYGVKSRIVVQPTGVDTEKFAKTDPAYVEKLRCKYGLTGEHHVLISIGRLSHEKNVKELLDMVEKISGEDSMVRLLIVGGGPEKENLQEAVAQKRLDAFVIFAGEVQWKDIQNYYALGDVFVCASNSETQGLTYIEALASGRPLLVRKDDCLNGVLKTGENGYAYESEEDFSRYYRKLFQEREYLEMTKHAGKTVEEVSSDVFGRNMEGLYRTILAARSMKRKEGAEYGTMRKVAG